MQKRFAQTFNRTVHREPEGVNTQGSRISSGAQAAEHAGAVDGRGQLFLSSSASITMIPLGPRT